MYQMGVVGTDCYNNISPRNKNRKYTPWRFW